MKSRFFVFALVLITACTSRQDLGDGQSVSNNAGDGGMAPDGGGVATADGAGITPPPSDAGQGMPVGTPRTPQQTCQALLACAATQTPSQVGQYQPVYGAAGTCWQTNTASACGAACQQAIDLIYDGERACNACVTSADCKGHWRSSLDGPVCDPQSSLCVECLADKDCPRASTCVSDDAGSFLCPTYCGAPNVAPHVCVACNIDSDCAGHYAGSYGFFTPVCAGAQCAQCRTSADCQTLVSLGGGIGGGEEPGLVCQGSGIDAQCICQTSADFPAGRVCDGAHLCGAGDGGP